MAYQIQFRTCRDQVGAMDPKEGQEYDQFATFADRLLTNQDLLVDIPGIAQGEHIDQVMLVYGGIDGKAVMVCSVFLLCPCRVTVDNSQRAQSDLMVAQKQLIIPR